MQQCVIRLICHSFRLVGYGKPSDDVSNTSCFAFHGNYSSFVAHFLSGMSQLTGDTGFRLIQRAVAPMLGWLTPQMPCVRPWWSISVTNPRTHQHLPCSSRGVHGPDSPEYDATDAKRCAPAPLPPTTPSWLTEDKALTAAKNAAMRALHRRSMHSSQLREKLLQRGHPPEAIEAALEVLGGRGCLHHPKLNHTQ